LKIAIIQDGPVYNDLAKSIEKTCDLISDAQQKSADLIVFGESWLAGYPVWLDVCKDVNLWEHEPVKEVWEKTYNNSIDLSADDLTKVQAILKGAKMYAIIGANEKQSSGKGNNTIYNSIVTINDSGEIVNLHRKLMPTYTEKLVHGLGDGAGLNAIDTPNGRIGSLICWEHWMPMTRQAMHDENEDLHIALWPFVKEMHHIASRHYAIEGRCHVISVGQIMDKSELPKNLEISDQIEMDSSLVLKGGSAVYGPDGSIIREPLYEKRDMIMVELDLKKNVRERMNLAVSGHYQRGDVFEYRVNKERR